jgi:hypothetical protein
MPHCNSTPAKTQFFAIVIAKALMGLDLQDTTKIKDNKIKT